MIKDKKQELIDELRETRRELRALYNDAESLASNIEDTFNNIDRIADAIGDGDYDDEEDENVTQPENDTQKN